MQSKTQTENKRGLLRNRNFEEVCLTVVTIAFIAAVHTFATQSRILMTAYYIMLWSAAYILLKRRRLTMVVFVLTVAFGMNLARNYFGPSVVAPSLHVNVWVDITTWCVLLILFGLLAREAFKINSEIRQMQVRREIEQKVISARSAALSCMAHELRTPIASVAACVETLESTMEGKIDEIEKTVLGLVRESSDHLNKLVDNLLDYGKAKEGSISFTPQHMDLPENIEGAVEMVKPQGRMRDIKIETQIDPSINNFVADPLQLRQIVLNLLSNAIKHSPDGKLVKVTVESHDSDVTISVRDAGRGMTSEQAEHIFDPYFQTTESDAQLGTGLGLGIVHLLVKQHGGSISVKSSPGEGSLFKVRLPHRNMQEALASIHDDDTWEDAVGEQTHGQTPACAQSV
ncbi:MAG: HAMP domain-containing histidine kinase [Planctomycetaceae bacterium]|jgi:signal transduction histidine kinase|nr:HAMP domain-containing histidine kinase [Planctomycetaceae bacterium]MBT6487348.1 HAMP domain-containing histidine kinase [Planctomycetaceae bacterium]MBT6493062.1 HAMP domain-containing histidine kinase [Planctomycetaceae bacterium]